MKIICVPFYYIFASFSQTKYVNVHFGKSMCIYDRYKTKMNSVGGNGITFSFF